MDLSDDDGQKQFADYNKLCIDKGFEGIMVKPITGIYECKRSSLWLKVKPFIEVYLKVIDTEEGTGRNAGKLIAEKSGITNLYIDFLCKEGILTKN